MELVDFSALRIHRDLRLGGGRKRWPNGAEYYKASSQRAHLLNYPEQRKGPLSLCLAEVISEGFLEFNLVAKTNPSLGQLTDSPPLQCILKLLFTFNKA
jgi:hypothetical protein